MYVRGDNPKIKILKKGSGGRQNVRKSFLRTSWKNQSISNFR